MGWTNIFGKKTKDRSEFLKDFFHGFLVVSESAEVIYKTTDYYAPQSKRCIRWDDP